MKQEQRMPWAVNIECNRHNATLCQATIVTRIGKISRKHMDAYRKRSLWGPIYNHVHHCQESQYKGDSDCATKAGSNSMIRIPGQSWHECQRGREKSEPYIYHCQEIQQRWQRLCHRSWVKVNAEQPRTKLTQVCRWGRDNHIEPAKNPSTKLTATVPAETGHIAK